MKRSQNTEGATLIVVVLFTLLLLAAILVATMRLSLTSRQNTADQAVTLQAQYAAESGISLVKSRLQDVQAILSSKNPVDKSDNFDVPGITTKEVVKAYAANFCGKNSGSAWIAAPEFAAPRSVQDPKSYPDAVQCTIDSGSAFTTERSGVLADYLKQSAYTVLPTSERPNPLTDRTTRLTWWNALLSDTDKTVGNAKYRILPVRVVQLSPTNYRFYIKATSVRAQGVQGSARRVLAATRTSSSDWWFEIVLPSLLDDVLMTNHHRAKPTGTYQAAGVPAVNFSDQIFDGSIHTNEKFLFTSNSSAQFKGKINSVGCTNLPQTGFPTGGDCTKTAGVYIGGTQTNPTSYTPPNGTSNVDKWIADNIAASPRTVQFVKKGTPAVIDYDQTDFTAAYKPLPLNENDQKAAAITGGLTLGTGTRGVELVAGGADGNPLTTYNATTKKWNEPTLMYQYIRMLRDKVESQAYACGKKTCYQNVVTGTELDPDNQYRFSDDKTLYKKNAGGGWDSMGRQFNGVIYGDTFQTVRGPSRKDGTQTNGSLDNVPPAVASFAGLTLASTNDITIDSDLTVSDTPCTFAETNAVPPCTKRPKNILGIYAQKGDVIFSKATGNNLNIHASIMSSEGEVNVEDYKTRPLQGSIKLIGSLIENWYGAFTLVGQAGYSRDFTYDQRLREGTIPPFFPVSPRWLAEDAKATGSSMSNLIVRQGTTSDF